MPFPGIGGMVGQMERFVGKPPRHAEWRFQSSVTSAVSTVVLPGSIITGDMMVLCDYARAASGTPTAVVPSGWGNTVDSPSGLLRGMVSFKRAGAAESGATVTGMNGTSANAKVCQIFRGYDQYGNVRNPPALDVSTPLVQHVTTDPAAQTVLTKLEFDPYVVLLNMGTDGTLAAAAGIITQGGVSVKDSDRNNSTNKAGQSYYLGNGWELWDTVCDMADYGTNFMASFYIAGTDPALMTAEELDAKRGRLLLPPEEEWATLFPNVDPALLRAARMASAE